MICVFVDMHLSKREREVNHEVKIVFHQHKYIIYPTIRMMKANVMFYFDSSI